MYDQKMQIMQERWEYDSMTNSMKFMQQASASLSESDNIAAFHLPDK